MNIIKSGEIEGKLSYSHYVKKKKRATSIWYHCETLGKSF